MASSWFLLLTALGAPLILAVGVALGALAVSMLAFAVAGRAGT